MEKRHIILSAAYDVFKECGYDGATLDEVARRAEFAKGTLYSYFGSKAELFEALVQQEFDAVVRDTLAELDREATPEGVIRTAFRVLLKHIARHNEFFQLALVHEEAVGREDAKRIRAVIFSRVGELMEGVAARLATGKKSGIFKDYPLQFLAFFLLILVQHYSAYKIMFEEGAPLGAADVDVLYDVYMDGVRATVRPPEAV